ncbi:MAG: CAP domain-containing protein, partial [Verrucomicrobiales bacterium]
MELINRARANPAAEGELLAAQALSETSVYSDAYAFGTQLSLMKAEMAAISPAPPLSFNENLISVARTHNNNMLTVNQQTHFSSSSIYHYQQRMDRGGYVWSQAGENIFASALNVREAHASFEIDWGSGTGGMRNPRGHRNSIHNPGYREIGIGYLVASSSSLGPSLITQDFGERISRATIKPYITGVAIYDADGDNFYDIGEGIAGVRVEVVQVSSGQSEDHFAVTSDSGGYSVPIDGGAGDYRVSFTLPGGAVEVRTVSVESEFHTQYSP